MNKRVVFEEIPSAEDRSFVIAATMRAVFDTGARYVVGQFAHVSECITEKAATRWEADALASDIEKRTGCWTCICDESGVLWQAYVAMIPVDD